MPFGAGRDRCLHLLHQVAALGDRAWRQWSRAAATISSGVADLGAAAGRLRGAGRRVLTGGDSSDLQAEPLRAIVLTAASLSRAAAVISIAGF